MQRLCGRRKKLEKRKIICNNSKINGEKKKRHCFLNKHISIFSIRAKITTKGQIRLST
jgi:hypothetical protein